MYSMSTFHTTDLVSVSAYTVTMYRLSTASPENSPVSSRWRWITSICSFHIGEIKQYGLYNCLHENTMILCAMVSGHYELCHQKNTHIFEQSTVHILDPPHPNIITERVIFILYYILTHKHSFPLMFIFVTSLHTILCSIYSSRLSQWPSFHNRFSTRADQNTS